MKKYLTDLKSLPMGKANEFVKLFNDVDYKFFKEDKKIPLKVSFVEKNDEIDRSTLYSFDGPLQLLHEDVANLEFLWKSATDPKYCLVIVDLFS